MHQTMLSQRHVLIILLVLSVTLTLVSLAALLHELLRAPPVTAPPSQQRQQKQHAAPLGSNLALSAAVPWPEQPSRRRWPPGAPGNLGNSTVLPNGLVLPPQWPPRADSVRSFMTQYNASQVPTSRRPSIMPIDNGRQLFVDDALIARRDRRLRWRFHQAGNETVVLAPSQAWELGARCRMPSTAVNPGGVWWDPVQRRYRLWLSCGCLVVHSKPGVSSSQVSGVCHAYSADGIVWTRDTALQPAMHLPTINYTGPANFVTSSDRGLSMQLNPQFGVWLDLDDPVAEHRWKGVLRSTHAVVYASADGIAWKPLKNARFKCYNRCSIHKLPWRHRWVYSLRINLCDSLKRQRVTAYYEATSLSNTMPEYLAEAGSSINTYVCSDLDTSNGPVYWMREDPRDAMKPWIRSPSLFANGIYSSNHIAYESIMLGLLDVFLGGQGMLKSVQIYSAFSRDGFYYSRTPRDADTPHRPLVPEHLWTRTYIQSSMGGVVVTRDRIMIYYNALDWSLAHAKVTPPLHDDALHEQLMSEALRSTRVAFLRRDGFASIDCTASVPETTCGCIDTVPVVFRAGRFPFLNADCQNAGKIRVGILDAASEQELDGFGIADSVAMTRDDTKQRMIWTGSGKDGALPLHLQGYPVRFRFCLQGTASLYSFWVSPWSSGESNGYVAAGGAEYPGQKDVPFAKAA